MKMRCKLRLAFDSPCNAYLLPGLDLTALDFDPERFVDFYAQTGWMVGRSHMKDWKPTVRNWLRTSKPRNGSAKEVPDDGFSAYD